jgi:hypothetical protein
MIVYTVKDATGEPIATVRAEHASERPVSITPAGPQHIGMVQYIEDLMEMYPAVTTSMLLTRFGPYSQVEVASSDEEPSTEDGAGRA